MSFGSVEGANIYFNLLGGNITAGALDTQLADGLALGKFKHLLSVNSEEYKNILTGDATALAILNDSSVYQGIYVWNAGFMFSGSSSDLHVFSFSTETDSLGATGAINGSYNAVVTDVDRQQMFIHNGALDTNLYKYVISTETYSLLAASSSRTSIGAMGQVFTRDKGWFAGGVNAGTYYTDIQGIDFATEARNTESATLDFGREWIGGFQSEEAGYWVNGWSSGGGYSTSGNKFVKSTVTRTSFTSSTIVRAQNASFSDATNGYRAAGVNGGGNLSSVDEFDYATNTFSSILANIGFSGGCTGVQNANGKAYIQKDATTEFYSFDPSTDTAENLGSIASQQNTQGWASSGYGAV